MYYDDFRSFVFLLHNRYGMLLLYNTNKETKGPHYNLPGGHLEKRDFYNRKLSKHVTSEDIISASKIGAARELFEETGIDLRFDLDRFQPAILSDVYSGNMLEDRYYYYLFVTDKDFLDPVSFFKISFVF